MWDLSLGADATTTALLCAVAFMAGLVDAIAGGGGLLTIPSMLVLGIPPVTAVATNKVQGTLSIVSALLTYHRAGMVEWRAGLPMIAAAFIFGICGALSVSLVPKTFIVATIPALLFLVALYFLFARGIGDADRHARLSLLGFMGLAVPPLAFYDGFLGPGARSFYAVALILLLGFGLTRTTAMAKLLNGGSNAGALLLFALAGQIDWFLGLTMGAASILGAQLGSILAVRIGARLIRPLIVVVSTLLSVRMLLDPTNPAHQLIANLLGFS